MDAAVKTIGHGAVGHTLDATKDEQARSMVALQLLDDANPDLSLSLQSLQLN